MGASDSALSQLVKVSEKFFNSDSFHHNGCLETVLNIVRVVRYVNVSLSESGVDHINFTCVSLEEGRDLLLADTNLFDVADFTSFGDVCGEHVFRSINIAAEMEVVDLFLVAAIAVTANNQIENGVRRGHDVQIFHYS